MCTMGMFKRHGLEGESTFVAAKTVDTQPTRMVHERLELDGGVTVLSFRMGWQPGVNAGMNEHGLVVMSSYLGWRKPSRMRQMPNFQHDTRGLANRIALQRHTAVEPAVNELAGYLHDHPSSVGGVHFLMDAEGQMAVVEHAEGQVAVDIVEQAVPSGFQAVVRANHAQFIAPTEIDGDTIDAEDAADRNARFQRMSAGLSGLDQKDWLPGLKHLLGSHLNAQCRQQGQICIHGFRNDGQRSISHAVHSTATALIFDIPARTMIYSEGAPCLHQWRSLTF